MQFVKQTKQTKPLWGSDVFTLNQTIWSRSHICFQLTYSGVLVSLKKYELQCGHSTRECKTSNSGYFFSCENQRQKEFNMTSEVKYILPVLSVCTTTDSVNFTPVYRTSVTVIVGKRKSWVLQKLQVNKRLESSLELDLVVNSRLIVTAGRCAHLFSRPVSSRKYGIITIKLKLIASPICL